MTSLTFDEASHTYYLNGRPADWSVTKFIGQYFPPFHEEEVMNKLGIVGGVDRAIQSYAWALSSPEGTLVHRCLEAVVRGEYITAELHKLPEGKIRMQVSAGISALREVFRIFPRTDGWVYTPERRGYFVLPNGKIVAGTADLRLSKDNQIVLFDYKTSRKLTRDAYGEKAYEPIAQCPASKFHKYSLQMHGYGAIEKFENPEAVVKLKALVHLRHDGTFEFVTTQDRPKDWDALVNLHC